MTLLNLGFDDVCIIKNPVDENFSFSNVEKDIILMDVNLAGSMNGFEVTQKLIQENKDLKILFVSMHAQPSYSKKAIDMGARGYVVKNAPLTELKEGIEKVHSGELFFCKQIREANQF